MSGAGSGIGLWRLAGLNLLRKPGRSLMAALGVVLAAGTAMAGALIAAGVHAGLSTGMDRLGADLMVVPEGAVKATHAALVVGEPVAFYMDGDVTGKVAAVSGVAKAAPQVYVETLSSAACCTGRLFVVGFDPVRDFTVTPWVSGALSQGLQPAEILVGNHILTPVGEIMKFFGTEFRVAARLEGTGMGADETVFLPVESVWEIVRGSAEKSEKPLAIPLGSISSVMVRVDGAQPEEVARRITEAVPAVSVLTSGDVTRGVSRDLGRLMGLLTPVMIGVTLVSVVLFLVLFSAVAAERAREIGLLRAVGATRPFVIALLVGEAALLGATGGFAGAGAGLGLFALFQRALFISYTLPYAWPSWGAQVGLVIAMVAGAALLSGLAAAWPAWRLARYDPYYVIHAR